MENRRSWASAVARSARSCSFEVASSRRVHIRPLGAGVDTTSASTVAPLAARTGSVIRTGARAEQELDLTPAQAGEEIPDRKARRSSGA